MPVTSTNKNQRNCKLSSIDACVFSGRRHWNKIDSHVTVLLVIASLCCFLPGLGSFGILDPSDGYYSEGAREMVESGNFLTPHLNYRPWFDKPILNYWLIAAAYKVFGVSEFSARLPSAVCASLLVVLSYVFGRQFLRSRAALFSSLILLSSPIWLIVGHLSMTDMPLTFFVWLSLASLFLSIERLQSLVPLGYASLGLAVLCKGPLAVVLVLMSLGTYILITTRSKDDWAEVLRRLQLFTGIAITAFVSLPWYVIEISTTHGAFFQEFFVNQNLNRALGNVDHRASALYYIPIILGGFFPWIIIGAAALPTVYGPFKRFFKWPKPSPPSAKLLFFSSTTALLTLLFFSTLPTKLATYILPALPALAFVVGISLDRLLILRKASIMRWTGLVLAFAALLTLFAFVTFHLVSKNEKLSSPLLISCGAYCIALFGYAVVLWQGRLTRALSLLMASSLIGGGIITPLGLQAAYDLKNKDFHALLRQAQLMGGNPLLVGRRNPSAIFYLRHKVKYFPEANSLAQYIKASPGKHVLLVNKGSMEIISRSTGQVKIIEQRGAWYLAIAGDKGIK